MKRKNRTVLKMVPILISISDINLEAKLKKALAY